MSEMNMGLRVGVEELVYRSAMALDALDFDGFMALCGEKFHYQITAHSPEIRKDMTWLEHDRAGIQLLFKNLPKHNSDRSRLSRHVTVYTVEIDPSGTQAKTISGLQVFRTTLDGGATELFAVGKMVDVVEMQSGKFSLLDRQIKLDTRMLGIGFHIPF